MNRRPFVMVASLVFAAVAILHGVRAINSTPVLAGETQVPLWTSWLFAVLAAFLSLWGFSLLRRRD